MKTTTSQSRKSAFILAGSIAALLAVQSVRASTTINPGDTFDIDNSNTTATGNTTTFNDAGSMTIFNGGTLQVHPGQNDNIPFSNNLIFTGTAGTISLKFNNNDTDYRFNGPITSTATGAQTLAIETGFQGNGDRESVTFVQGIPDAGVDPLSLNVRFTTQSGSQSYVNLNGNNSFTGPITLVKGENVTSAYLTIGGVFTRNGNNPNDGVQGSGKLGGGSYAGAISLDTNTILNYYSSATQTLSGDISGAGSVMQSGDGLLTLSGNNTYTGATTIWSGKTLVIGGGSNTTSGVANDGVLSFNHVGAVSFSAPISGSGSVKKQGVGALTLAGSSTYSGGTTVENGVLSLSQDASLGAASGGLVVKGGTVEATSSFTLDSSRNLQLGAGAIISVSPSSTLSYNGTVANAPAVTGSLTKSGAGTLVLGGADSYTGLTSVNSGQLIATNGSALGGGGGLSVSSSATFAYKPMAPGALNLGSGSLTLANNSTIGTALSGTASQSVISTSGAASVSGNVTVNIFVGNTFTPGVNNLITAAGGLIAGSPSYAVQIYNDTNFAISGLTVTNTAISVNASNVAAYADLHWKGGYNGGDNVWALSNGNNQSNWATNSGGGTRTGQVAGPTTTVHLSASGAINQGAMVLGADMSVAGVVASDTTPTTLQADGNKLTVGASGITVNAGATVTIATPVVLGAGQAWTNNSVNPLTVSGAVSGGGNLTKAGSGTVILSSSQSTYTGATAVTGGTLAVGDGTGALPTLATSGITLSNNANLTLNHTGTASFS
ncbi:MAG: autotransporter-associated beta strand repeat-containing protein, partial [Verrucomicrobiota bacterium]